VCAQLVDSEDAGAGVGAGAEAGYAFVPDLMAGLEHTYSPPSFGLRRGMFFPALLAEPARFLAPRPTTRAWLEAQRSRGRRLFLVTNSHVDFSEFVMQARGPRLAPCALLRCIAAACNGALGACAGVIRGGVARAVRRGSLLCAQGQGVFRAARIRDALLPAQARCPHPPVRRERVPWRRRRQRAGRARRRARAGRGAAPASPSGHARGSGADGAPGAGRARQEYLQGHHSLMGGWVRDPARAAYFGDHLLSDVLAVRDSTAWSAVALVSELRPADEAEAALGAAWGDFFAAAPPGTAGGAARRSFLGAVAEDAALVCIADFDDLS